MLKKIFGSKWFKFIFSAVLIYFAFRKVNAVKLLRDISEVPLWFVMLNILISFCIVFIISIRWTMLLFPKVKLVNVLTFTRASFLAAFYSLFFPTAVAGDVSKWLMIDYKYPEISKTKILGSVLFDRFIGFSVFMLLGLVSAIVGRKIGLVVPEYIFYLLIILSTACFVIYLLIYFFDVSKLLPRISLLKRFEHVFELLKGNNKKQITKCLLMSVLSEVTWMLQMWFIGWKFGADLSIISVFVFMPLIYIILVLPISIGGFGAREQLFLFFFSQVGSSDESILLMSTFLGILGVINALFGGTLSFFDPKTREQLKRR